MAWTPGLVLDYARALRVAIEPPPLGLVTLSRAGVNALRGLRAVVFRGAGVPDVAGWDAEPSWLALGVAMPAARRLARRYGQNAVVAGRLDGPARLVWCR